MAIDRLKWLQENPAACVAPFTGLSLRAHYDGKEGIRYSCCCNLDVQYVESSKEQEFFQSLRDDFSQGRKHSACSTCYRLEEAGIISERMRYLLDYDDRNFQDFTSRWHSETFEVKVKFSNACPLACRSCHGFESSTHAMITRNQSAHPNLFVDFTDDDKNFQEIKNIIIDISQRYRMPALHLIGGEPLVQHGCVRLMDWMIEQDLAKKFELRLTTSWAVNLNNSFLEKIQHFRHIYFLLSIDSVGENYQYVRWPVKFSKVENNLESLLEILPSLPSSTVNLIPVFSLNNIFYTLDYIDYFYRWAETNQQQIFLSNQSLHDPDYFSVGILPDPYRSDLANLLRDCLKHRSIDDFCRSVFKNFLETTIDQLETKPGDERLFAEYLRYTAEFDVRTGTKMQDLNSRLYDRLLPHHLDVYHSHISAVDKNKFIGISVRKADHAYNS